MLFLIETAPEYLSIYLSGLRALSFPSFPHHEPLHLQYLNMSLAGAHHFVASNGTFNEAKTVRSMFTKGIHQAS